MELFGIDFREVLIQLGLIGVVVVIFAESSLIFFLPGDSFLFVAGLLAARGDLNIWSLIILATLAAILGNSFGYFIGRQFSGYFTGDRSSWLFKKEYLEKTEHYFQRYGAMTILLARYIPAVRTFAPILAGIGRMKYSTFLFYNVVGAALWVVILTLLGYFLGNAIPNIDHYLLPIIGIIIAASLLPALAALAKNKKS